jgi:uncharacterized protein (UPF0276 family)
MTDAPFLRAIGPMLESGSVDVLEWNFDLGWGQPVPEAVDILLRVYGAENRLLGRGVSLSLFSGAPNGHHRHWMDRFENECRQRHYVHVTEEFGFLTAGGLDIGLPLPVPPVPRLAQAAAPRLSRMRDTGKLPVGLRNRAFAFGEHDVAAQGPMLAEVLDAANGFLSLDLHAVYCQMVNFECSPFQILNSYPLHRVREIVLSGGSWTGFEGRPELGKVRCDTRDMAVPEEVFELLRMTLKRCPQTEYVVLERFGHTMGRSGDAWRLQQDFHHIRGIVKEESHGRYCRTGSLSNRASRDAPPERARGNAHFAPQSRPPVRRVPNLFGRLRPAHDGTRGARHAPVDPFGHGRLRPSAPSSKPPAKSTRIRAPVRPPKDRILRRKPPEIC